MITIGVVARTRDPHRQSEALRAFGHGVGVGIDEALAADVVEVWT